MVSRNAYNGLFKSWRKDGDPIPKQPLLVCSTYLSIFCPYCGILSYTVCKTPQKLIKLWTKLFFSKPFLKMNEIGKAMYQSIFSYNKNNFIAVVRT